MTRFGAILMPKARRQPSSVPAGASGGTEFTYSAAAEAALVVDSIKLAVVASILVPITSAAVNTLVQNPF